MNTLKYKKQRHIILSVLFIVLSGSWVSGCGTETDLSECPDTSFSQTNLDTLEAKDPKFIWRVCNANDEYAMENLIVEYNWDLHTLEPCNCSKYFASIVNENGVEFPIGNLTYQQDGEEYLHIYLESLVANKGLTDSTSVIREILGRYTYYVTRDTSKHSTRWVEIEREAYYLD